MSEHFLPPAVEKPSGYNWEYDFERGGAVVRIDSTPFAYVANGIIAQALISEMTRNYPPVPEDYPSVSLYRPTRTGSLWT